MRCELFSMLVQRYHDGELSAVEMAEYKNHLRDCAACRRIDAEYAGMFVLLESIHLFQPSEDFDSKVMARVDISRYRVGLARRAGKGLRKYWNGLPVPLRSTALIASIFALFVAVYSPIIYTLIGAGRRLVALAGSGLYIAQKIWEDPVIVTNYLDSVTNYRIAGKIIFDTLQRQLLGIPIAHITLTVTAVLVILVVVIRMTRVAWKKGETHVGIF
ncbi:MAG: zf-HC2 domain-containing protein [Candidatus Krumholzibacteriota bacterium]|nr:zf-HC2 domain-containing protein [Candidatus Krumholzibacteriota bacterium]